MSRKITNTRVLYQRSTFSLFSGCRSFSMCSKVRLFGRQAYMLSMWPSDHMEDGDSFLSPEPNFFEYYRVASQRNLFQIIG
jgi:hypothetical protein